MNRSNLYNWEYIEKACITHRSDLERIGFSDDDGPTKLPYLARALEKQVCKNLVSISNRNGAALIRSITGNSRHSG
jgi:hypothetical protein